MTTTNPSGRIPVALAARSALQTGEACRLLSAASSEPLEDAQAARVGDTIVVTAVVTATYVYQVYTDSEDDG